MKSLLLLSALAFPTLFGADVPGLSKADCARLATEMEAHLDTHIIHPWYPRSVDKERGGFIQDYAEDWTEKRDGNKTLVYQSRLTWMAAQVALSFPERAKEFVAYSNHGLDFLADKMWDKENGGFFWSVDASGKPTNERGGEKHVYGISFGLYAASVNYKATKNPKALELANKTFDWLQKHAFDAAHKGYFEALTVKGEPILNPPINPGEPQTDHIGTRYGMKSMNTHIHLLEAFTAYNEIAPGNTGLAQLLEMVTVVKNRIAVEPGCLNKFFNADWKVVPDLDSFGHDIETAFLLVEAQTLEKEKVEPSNLDSDLWTLPRHIVDHALEFGWDAEHGGFYDEGTTFRKVFEKDKVWWVQAEGLNALLLMHEHYGAKNPKYGAAFLKEWEFIKKYQTDAKHKGWISYLETDGTPKPGQVKSDQWKDPYHQGRAVITSIERLKRMAK
ncbi:MAG: AGE family epimerase/isomerase [Planctomycetota bacterium]